MGVRGLTSYIARRAEQYLTPFELHDCNLVIDGDNLACNLYNGVTGTYSAFGGDYDDFYRAVVKFIGVLKECNVQPFVLCDGGYEFRKMHTVATRLRGKIAIIKRINPCGSVPVFPVMMKEVFVDALRDCGVPVMRCTFEADDELAALGRKLNCPVLSYDSDFYIHNVRYIPLVTLTLKAHTKVLKNNEGKPKKEERRLRKNEAKHFEKRMKAHRIMEKTLGSDAKKSENKSKKKSYKFLDCCIYRIENLARGGALSKEKLPLFAALLGNDYIAKSAFKNFFAVGLGKRGRCRKTNQQQRRIKVILEWLRTETVQSALQKILSRLKAYQRDSLQAQVSAAISGYSNERCESYDYFSANYAEILAKYPPPVEDEANSIEDDDFELVEEDEEELSEEEEEDDVCDDDDEVDDAERDLCEEETIRKDIVGEPKPEESDDDESSTEAEVEEGDIDEDEVENTVESDDPIAKFPSWFLEKLYPAHLPRFLVDLMYLRKYINSPQIEHFPYPDANEIALPILTYIFSLINKVEGEEPLQKFDKDGAPLPIEFTYLTRTVRVTNVHYKRIAMQPETVKYPFNPREPDPLLLREVFKDTPHLQVDKLIESLNDLPRNLRLYFMAIVYWLHRSQYCDLLHLNALLLCLVVLQTVDAKIPAERDLRAFHKRFGKIIKTERQVRDKEVAQNIKRTLKPEVQALPVPQRVDFIQKSDCYLVQHNLLKHFHMQEIFKKKYDLYSSSVLHGFAEFQAVLFQLHALNALLDFPYESPRLGQLYCGVFIYNLYDLLKSRTDIRFYVEKFLLQDSKMMFDYYCFLCDWCDEFVPEWKRPKDPSSSVAIIVNKKVLKKQRQAARKKTAQLNAQILLEPSEEGAREPEEDEFLDLNNKFCTLLKVS